MDIDDDSADESPPDAAPAAPPAPAAPAAPDGDTPDYNNAADAETEQDSDEPEEEEAAPAAAAADDSDATEPPEDEEEPEPAAAQDGETQRAEDDDDDATDQEGAAEELDSDVAEASAAEQRRRHQRDGGAASASTSSDGDAAEALQRRVDELYDDNTFNELMLHVSSNILSEEFIAHMGKFYEAGESFWLRDLEKIYLMRLALGPSGVDGPQPATAALLTELQPEYWADDGFLSKYVQADGLESFEGRFGVEVMLGIANDDMDISDLMAPYVKETLAGVAAKDITFHIPGKETPEEGLRRGGGLPPEFLAGFPQDALAHVLEWVSPRPPAPWTPQMIRRRVQDIARLKLVCKPFRGAAGLVLKQDVEAAVVERAKREAE